jgi:hypothetical protein
VNRRGFVGEVSHAVLGAIPAERVTFSGVHRKKKSMWE